MTMPKKPIVYIVHNVDAQGPMRETIEATWERIYLGDGIWLPVEPSADNLRKFQRGELDLDLSPEKMQHLMRKYSPENLHYLTSWEEIDRSILNTTSPEFRQKYCDKQGGDYTYSWLIYDHYGFTTNQRFHDVGIHAIWDHYHDLFLADNPGPDEVYWHYHHVTASGDALEWSTNWGTNSIHEEILARRVIEREWFPSVFRAGAHIERNDLSHWLEMFIPFDYSCRSASDEPDSMYVGHFRDWRHSPTNWGYYHPDWYDYRRPGDMKRYVIRCLDIKTWEKTLTDDDVEQAFQQARTEGQSLLVYYNHDYRDMENEVKHAYDVIKRVEANYPDVDWRFCTALDAIKKYLGKDDKAPQFSWELKGQRLIITSDVELFGPEPFLAIKENGRFFRDCTTREGEKEWAYTFRRPTEVEAFGIAGNSPMGNTGVVVHEGWLDLID